MALKEDYLDDILDTSVNEKRKYRMINNADGTISLEDVTEYSQNGDNFGAFDINITNKTVNELIAMGLNVRWNSESDYFEVLLNGNWEQTKVKSGIGELIELIPTLSDYNSSVGTCIYASPISTEFAPWKAFDNNVSTLGGCTGVGVGESSYIGFQWSDEVYIDNVSVIMTYTHGSDTSCSLNLKLQYYDGSNWVDVEDTEFNEVFTGGSGFQDRTYNFQVNVNAKGIRFFGTVSSISSVGKWALFIREMKAYERLLK